MQTHSTVYRDTDIVLSVEGVNKTFDGFKAISDHGSDHRSYTSRYW